MIFLQRQQNRYVWLTIYTSPITLIRSALRNVELIHEVWFTRHQLLFYLHQIKTEWKRHKDLKTLNRIIDISHTERCCLKSNEIIPQNNCKKYHNSLRH